MEGLKDKVSFEDSLARTEANRRLLFDIAFCPESKEGNIGMLQEMRRKSRFSIQSRA